jgi:hypothetical protein
MNSKILLGIALLSVAATKLHTYLPIIWVKRLILQTDLRHLPLPRLTVIVMSDAFQYLSFSISIAIIVWGSVLLISKKRFVGPFYPIFIVSLIYISAEWIISTWALVLPWSILAN